MAWKGVDHGREGLLARDKWYQVLKVLARHQGENLRNTESQVYLDLYDTVSDVAWIGKNGRPFFRDYSKPWTNWGVIRPSTETNGLIELTQTGHALLDDEQLLTEFFRGIIDDYSESWEYEGAIYSVSPFEIISRELLSLGDVELLDLRKRADAAALQIIGLDRINEFSGMTPTRRFRTYIYLLENARAIEYDTDTKLVRILDRPYLQQLVRDPLLSVHPESSEYRDLFAAVPDEDARARRFVSHVVRERQSAFSREVRNAYGHMCCVTGTTERTVLDAAHIVPYMGRATSHMQNGLLLATDIHRLFDSHLLAIEPKTLSVELASAVQDKRYVQYAGTIIRLPKDESSRPSMVALERQFELFRTLNR